MNKRYIASLTIVAFWLHLVWENIQAPLYAGYQSFAQHFPICLIGVVGDVIITFAVLTFFWLFKRDKPQIITDWLALALIGFMIAVAVEQHALLNGAWSYASAMPIIPGLNVGWTPIIQMTLLLPFSFYLAGILKKTYKKFDFELNWLTTLLTLSNRMI